MRRWDCLVRVPFSDSISLEYVLASRHAFCPIFSRSTRGFQDASILNCFLSRLLTSKLNALAMLSFFVSTKA